MQIKEDQAAGLFRAARSANAPQAARVESPGSTSGVTDGLARWTDIFSHPLGRAFVALYYRLSPPLAAAVREREPLKAAARWVLAPIVYGVRWLLNVK